MRAYICVSLWRSYLRQWFLIDLHGQHDRSCCVPVVVPATDDGGSYKYFVTPQTSIYKTQLTYLILKEES